VLDVVEVVFDNEEEEEEGIIKKINLRITVKKTKLKVKYFQINF
jgi:hypothetical protein